jgi:pyridoxine kinase
MGFIFLHSSFKIFHADRNTCPDLIYCLRFSSNIYFNCYIGGKKTELTICIPKLPCTFTGTGDLFAALLLAWMWDTNNQLKPSLEKTIATLQAVLKRTLHYAKGITIF